MATKLEIFFLVGPNYGKSTSRDSIAIGTDKQDISPLYDFVKAEYEKGNYPKTLARHLKLLGAEWSQSNNDAWTAEMARANSGISTAYICHTKARTALQTVARISGEAVSFDEFDNRYTGNRKATYKEIKVLLENGFNAYHFDDMGTPYLKR